MEQLNGGVKINHGLPKGRSVGGEMERTTLGNLKPTATAGLEQRNLVPLKNAANNSGGTGTAASTASSITANDFLTLLVTEMKNQDPTANTDPNEYINQLVQVNSLEQLISINQTLLTDSQGTAANQSASAPGTTIRNSVVAAIRAPHSVFSTGTSTTGINGNKALQTAVGNFSIPAPNPAAQRVAQSLGGLHPAL
jgi:flagellar basal-body rod modification protein FlgD